MTQPTVSDGPIQIMLMALDAVWLAAADKMLWPIIEALELHRMVAGELEPFTPRELT